MPKNDSGLPDIRIARVHDGAEQTTGARLLVDRVWPRGIARKDLRLDEWIREAAPSTGLRKWFGHDPGKWDEFRRRYCAEFAGDPDTIDRCLAWCRRGAVTLLYAARDRKHNQAVVLRDYLIARSTTEDETHDQFER